MPAEQPTILATSGGWRSGHRTNLEFGKLIHFAIDLSGVEGRAPRLCHVGTANGDQRCVQRERVGGRARSRASRCRT